VRSEESKTTDGGEQTTYLGEMSVVWEGIGQRVK
jgi:hypothetical protein